MKAQVTVALFLTVLVAAGCGGSPGISSASSSAAPDVTGNWMIASSVSSPGTIHQTLITLTGALQSSGKQVTGIFRPAIFAQGTSCLLLPIVNFNGSIDLQRNLTLASAELSNGATIKVSLGLSPGQPYSGTVEVDGGSCPIAPTAVTGLEFANTSGSFSGALTPGVPGAPTTGASGTGTLILVQSTTPDSSGRFPATGTLSYQFGMCSGSVALAGNVSGASIFISTADVAIQNPQTLTFAGATDAIASKLTSLLVFDPAPCSTDVTTLAAYSGTLARQ